MKVGDTATVTRSFRPREAVDLAALVGLEMIMDGLVPEPLIGGLLSSLLGRELPGPGTRCLELGMRFPRPALIGEPVTATVEVVAIRPEEHLAELLTTCTDAAGELLCEGRALVLMRSARAAPVGSEAGCGPGVVAGGAVRNRGPNNFI